ncbi:MAG: hypothetical protein RBR32_07825 [Bacteroidales bacterium]|nr:hypothetical protein [Bacteroidales bacterium]
MDEKIFVFKIQGKEYAILEMTNEVFIQILSLIEEIKKSTSSLDVYLKSLEIIKMVVLKIEKDNLPPSFSMFSNKNILLNINEQELLKWSSKLTIKTVQMIVQLALGNELEENKELDLLILDKESDFKRDKESDFKRRLLI